jgi:hypothetical protein
MVREALRSSGTPLDAATRDRFEPPFGFDFARVKIHTDQRAADSARVIGALAYTSGNDIVFGAGRFAPWTDAGTRLLAHELAHTAQQRAGALDCGAIVQRAPDGEGDIDVEKEYAVAVQMGDWIAAAEWLNGYNYEGIEAHLAQLTPEQIKSLHRGALDNPRLGSGSQIAQVTAPGRERASFGPPVASPTSKAAAKVEARSQVKAEPGKSIADMTTTEKLLAAYSKARINSAVREKIQSLITEEALCAAIMSFAAIFVASQFTPAGWIADIGLMLTAAFVGSALFTVAKHLSGFAAAADATTEPELQEAGDHLASALAEVEIDAIILFITHGVGGGPKAGAPPLGSVTPRFALATPEGLYVVVAAGEIPAGASVVSAAQAAQLGARGAAALTSMMASMGRGGASGTGLGEGAKAGPFGVRSPWSESRFESKEIVKDIAEETGKVPTGERALVEAGVAARQLRKVEEYHHLLVQQLRRWFGQRGVKIDKYTVKLSADEHRWIHNEYNWNELWKDFRLKNPKASPEEILVKMREFQKRVGLEGLEIVPYPK